MAHVVIEVSEAGGAGPRAYGWLLEEDLDRTGRAYVFAGCSPDAPEVIATAVSGEPARYPAAAGVELGDFLRVIDAADARASAKRKILSLEESTAADDLWLGRRASRIPKVNQADAAAATEVAAEAARLRAAVEEMRAVFLQMQNFVPSPPPEPEPKPAPIDTDSEPELESEEIMSVRDLLDSLIEEGVIDAEEEKVEPPVDEPEVQSESVEPEVQPEPAEEKVEPTPAEEKVEPPADEPEVQPESVGPEVEPEPAEEKVESAVAEEKVEPPVDEPEPAKKKPAPKRSRQKRPPRNRAQARRRAKKKSTPKPKASKRAKPKPAETPEAESLEAEIPEAETSGSLASILDRMSKI